MSTLRSTNVHYIRCIKPNADCLPQVFDRKQVFCRPTLGFFSYYCLPVRLTQLDKTELTKKRGLNSLRHNNNKNNTFIRLVLNYIH